MSVEWTSDQIIALAPDSKSVSAAQKLLVVRKWPTFGVNEEALWGECQGSGKTPYQTQIALDEPSFKCSCPSRKFPCKHGIALFLLYADNQPLFKSNTPPQWVQDWLDGRTQRKVKREEKQQNKKPVDEKAQAKRAEKREETVKQGIVELELWLSDLVRRGLVDVQGQPYSFWETIERRMHDSQSTGLASMLKEMGSGIVLKENWSNSVLTTLGSLHLLLESYKRIEEFPTEQQINIRTRIGWNQKTEEVLANPGLKDHWSVLGQYTEEEDRLTTQRIWLFGQNSKQFALILNFSFGPVRRLERGWLTGSQVEGELYFYPSTTPLRALAKEMGKPKLFTKIVSSPTIREALKNYKETLKKNPWFGNFPMTLADVVPTKEGKQWKLCDSENSLIDFHYEFTRTWDLIALCGGKPVTVFGEWRFNSFWPLGVWVENKYIELAPERVIA